MRAQLASPVLDFPTAWAQNADEYINKATQIHDDYRSNDLISTAFGPHAPYTVSDEPLSRIAALAEELDVPIHMHLHENAQEVTDAEATDGRRPCKDCGILHCQPEAALCACNATTARRNHFACHARRQCYPLPFLKHETGQRFL